ncbi:MAG: CotH kinase family protein, partial [Bacteroidales bacterium]|nr:CotH kinase family protein [Bacteroidales bacterium]
EVVLSNPNEEIIDQITTPVLIDDYSFGRMTDGSDSWGIFDVATPGKKNSNTKPLSATPVISPTAGFFTSSQKATITCSDASATIYYTTDGSIPTKSSKKYSGAITISKNTPLRAIAISNGCKESKVATATYFIKSRAMTLPVVSLVTDQKNFYDNKIGIYVKGTNGVAGKCSDDPVNWNQDWERPVHIEYFDKNQILQLSQDAGVKITGTCSRTNAMKSLRIIARQEYGDNRLRYKFFDKKDINKFKSIVLRNAGNDFNNTMIRDALITGIAGEGMDVDVQALQPAAVFLNGEYLGMHNIREKVSDHFAEENYGAESDLVDLLEYKGSNEVLIIDGDNKEYNALISFVEKNSLANQANYDKVASQIDIDNFIDYWIAQIYVGNWDWPNNNNKWWKARGKNTKWRWILFGTEYSCNVYGGQQPDENSVKRCLDEYAEGSPLGFSHGVNLLMRKLLENTAFKAKFLQRFSYHIDHTFRYARVKEFSDSLANLISTEMVEHANRWDPGLMASDWWNPSGNTRWQNNLNSLNSWFEQRAKYVSQHLRDYFSIPSRYAVTVSADINNVKFSVNGCPSTANITGKYFANINLNLSAVLPEGKAVDYWIVTSSNGNEQRIYKDAIDLSISGDVVVKLYTKDAAPVQLPERTVAITGLYINEVMPNNKGALSDETGHFPAWIEFYNSNDFAIDMAGLYIFDGKKQEYQIPGGSSELTTIPAKGHLVFFADGKPELGALHLGYTLKDEKENSVNLGQVLNKDRIFVDYMDAPAIKKNQSYGRSSDGAATLVTFVETTPFDKNSNGKVETVLPVYTYTGEDPDEGGQQNNNGDPNTPVSEVAVADLTVYPNPTSDYVRIDSNLESVSYALYTISGEKLLAGQGKQVDMSNVPSGMYVLRAYVGDALQNVKVIKR